jgi:hypothetical protein
VVPFCKNRAKDEKIAFLSDHMVFLEPATLSINLTPFSSSFFFIYFYNPFPKRNAKFCEYR